MTTGVGSTPTTNTSTPSTGSSSSSSSGLSNVLGSNFNTFLTLLTTQLQNQDPTSPLDTNQFTSQLVQFSQVEQAINTNTNLQTLITLQQGDQSVAALPLVGQTVQYSDDKGALVNGQAEFGYSLPAAASSATISINDANGNTVYQGPADTAQGAHTFTWNGQGSNGTQEPDGTYTFSVSATAPDNSAITAAISAYGQVKSVAVDSGVANVEIGDLSEPITKIISVNQAGSSS
jgi:flagellar basal-body rod modification protein FlgD